MMTAANRLRRKLRLLLADNEMHQHEFAYLMAKSQGWASKILNFDAEKNRDPRIADLDRIALIFRCDIADLFQMPPNWPVQLRGKPARHMQASQGASRRAKSVRQAGARQTGSPRVPGVVPPDDRNEEAPNRR